MKAIRVSLLFVTVALARGGELTIDGTKAAGRVSPRLYGLMTEEINYSYDGGLYAELIRNRAFLDNLDTPASWTLVKDAAGEGAMSLDKTQPLNDVIPVSLRFEVTKAGKDQRVGFANNGYWGIPVQPNTQYRASFYAKALENPRPVTLSIESGDGRIAYASGTTQGLTKDWRRFELVLKTGDVAPTTKARYVVRLDRPGTAWFSMVSLFPPTWNDRPNGLRKDLMQMLVDLKPKFLRFPGGNYLEGNRIDERFPWKKTLGPISQRPGHQCPWGYRSSDGMGLLEFLEWCEDMGAEPVLAVYAGYSLGGERVAAGKDLGPYVQDAIDEIEYVTGDAVTTKWGARRAKDGHPAPFPLHYVEIGNEDGFDKACSYDARFTQFFDGIKAKHPSLKCIATVSNHDVQEKRVHSRRPDVFDEHYYSSAEEFLSMGRSQYEKYDRNGQEVFVGEWAAFETQFPPWDRRSADEPPTATLRAALGDAAFMTDLERNSDVVVMHCYAPLFANVNPGGRQWRPDLIGYDALRSFGSPSYYAIKMFSTHLGDQILKVTDAGTAVLASATRVSATGEIYLKVVNPKPSPEPVTINIPGAPKLAPTAFAMALSAASADMTNSIDSPRAVVPATTTISGVKSGFSYTVPANGIVVLTLKPE
jgi:alpha-N-arabinofuranosidase